jgi:hypothetical protein
MTAWDRHQAMTALAGGNDLRIRRAAIRRELQSSLTEKGLRYVAAELRAHADNACTDDRATLAGVPVADLLRWPRRCGNGYAKRVADAAGVPRVASHAWLPVCNLTPREANSIAAVLESRAQNLEGIR